MKTFDLTDAELKVARILVQSCLDGMGGSRPSSLEHDEYTWIYPEDLYKHHGYSKHETAGFYSSLEKKDFISEADKGEWVVNTSAWQWMDTIWDTL